MWTNSQREIDSTDLLKRVKIKKMQLTESTQILNTLSKNKSAQKLDRLYQEFNDQQQYEKSLISDQPSFGSYLFKQNEIKRLQEQDQQQELDQQEQDELESIKNLMPSHFNKINNDIYIGQRKDMIELKSNITSQQQKSQDLTIKAIDQIDRRFYDVALSYLNRGIVQKQKDPLIYYCKGLCYYYQKKFIKAIIYFNSSLQISPSLNIAYAKIEESIQYYNQLVLLKLYNKCKKHINKFEIDDLISREITLGNFQLFYRQKLPKILETKDPKYIFDFVAISMNVIDNNEQGRDIQQQLYQIGVDRVEFVQSIIIFDMQVYICLNSMHREFLIYIDYLINEHLFDQNAINQDFFTLKANILYQLCDYIQVVNCYEEAYSRGIENIQLRELKEESNRMMKLKKDQINYIHEQKNSRINWQKILKQVRVDEILK